MLIMGMKRSWSYVGFHREQPEEPAKAGPTKSQQPTRERTRLREGKYSLTVEFCSNFDGGNCKVIFFVHPSVNQIH